MVRDKQQEIEVEPKDAKESQNKDSSGGDADQFASSPGEKAPDSGQNEPVPEPDVADLADAADDSQDDSTQEAPLEPSDGAPDEAEVGVPTPDSPPGDGDAAVGEATAEGDADAEIPGLDMDLADVDLEVIGATDPSGAQPRAKKKKKKKKSRAKTAKDLPTRQLSHHEVLSRLLEKNEVILQLTKSVSVLRAKVKAIEDKRLRTLAEFENYRKRTRKEWELLKQQTTAEVILEILEVVDDFERAFAMVGNRSDDFVQGIRLIYNNMMSALVKFGVSKMEALHARFDPTFHMAVANLDSKDVESNHVVEVIQDGYLLGDTVIRPAKVVIAK